MQENEVSNNYSAGIGGAGIEVGGAGGAQIVSNVVENNSASANGGGMTLWGAGTPILKNNIIRANTGYEQGGGMYIVNYSDVLLVQNLIYNNSLTYGTSSQGAGIYLLVPEGYRGPLLVNNTIMGSSSSLQGSAVYAEGYYDQVQFYNNLMIGASGTNAVFCDSTYDATPPTVTNNDAYSVNGSGLQGACSAQGNTNGNISARPMFVTSSFQLKADSPAVNVGDSLAPDLSALDLAGNPRMVDGTIGLGAYEYQPPAPEAVTPALPQ